MSCWGCGASRSEAKGRWEKSRATARPSPFLSVLVDHAELVPPGPDHRGTARSEQKDADQRPGQAEVRAIVGKSAHGRVQRVERQRDPEKADAEAGEQSELVRLVMWGRHGSPRWFDAGE